MNVAKLLMKMTSPNYEGKVSTILYTTGRMVVNNNSLDVQKELL